MPFIYPQSSFYMEELEQILTGIINKENDFQELRSKLSSVISELLHRDFQKLIQIMYRFDVKESKVKEALTLEPDKIAARLAELMLERAVEKIKIREKYKRDS